MDIVEITPRYDLNQITCITTGLLIANWRSGKGQLFRATLVQLSKIGLSRHASEYRSLYLPGAVTTYRFRGSPLEHRITARSSK